MQEPQDVTVKKGSSFLWNCSAKNTVPEGDFKITWRKDGTDIQEKRRYVLRNGALFFKRIVHRKDRGQSDEGYYECLAQNKDGTIVSNKARLKVAGKKKNCIHFYQLICLSFKIQLILNPHSFSVSQTHLGYTVMM